MANLTRERAGQMVRAAFATLLEHPEGMPARDVIGPKAHILDIFKDPLNSFVWVSTREDDLHRGIISPTSTEPVG